MFFHVAVRRTEIDFTSGSSSEKLPLSFSQLFAELLRNAQDEPADIYNAMFKNVLLSRSSRTLRMKLLFYSMRLN